MVAALLPPGSQEPVFLIPATLLTVAIGASALFLPWGRLPGWAQAVPPMTFFGVVVLAELAASESSPSLLPLMLLPVLWLAANGTRAQVVAGLAGLGCAGTIGLLVTQAASPDWRRAVVSLLVAWVISLSVQRVVESSRRSEARYRTLVDHLPDMAVVTFNRDLRYDLVAGSALENFGIERGQFEGKTIADVFPDEEGRAEMETIYRAALDGRESALEYSSARNPSRELWLRAVPLREAGGSVSGGMIVSQDVTERNRAEAAAREAQELFRRAFEDGEVGMAIVSLDGHYLRVNRSLCRIVGRPEEELRGRPFADITHPDDREDNRDAMREMVAGDRDAYRCQKRYLLPGGGIVRADLACSMVRDDKQRPMYFAIQVEDVTARHEAEEELRLHEEITRNMAEGVVLVRTADWEIVYANQKFEEMFGYEPGELIGLPVDAINAPGEPRREGQWSGEVHSLRKDGTDFWCQANLSNFDHPEHGTVSVGVHTDITVQRRMERQRREAEERFRSAFEDAGTGMAVIGVAGDKDGRFLEVNDQLCLLTGYPREQLLRMTEASLLHPDDLPELDEGVRDVMAGKANAHSGEVRLVSAAGETLWASVSSSVVRDAEGEPQMRLVQMLDISERKRFEGQLQHLADHDPLTGLINRRRFEEELERELTAAKRYDRAGAVLVLDLDNFKYVNDTHGHSAGDELIVTVSSLLRRRLRESDTLSRIGGDEFAVILPDCTPAQAESAADGLLGTIREGMLEHHRSGRSSASIGVAPYDAGHQVTGEELLVEADVAMYEAKERGRDRVEVFDHDASAPSPLNGRLTWARRIEQALTEDGFELHAQPILSLRDDPVERHELLVRMRGENGDLIPPAAFLGVAERFELIQSIDRWVADQAISLLAARQRAGEPVCLEVNLSAKSVTDPDLPDFIEDRLRAAQVDASGLIFEVTETAAIVNVDRARLFADRLGEVGCGFALDDFGAGFASFYYLKHLDFDLLKIDGEFIRDLPHSRTNQLVVRSLVELAQGLDKHTVAEFVGDEPTLELLRSFGVDYAQGFHVGRPLPAAQVGLSLPEVSLH